MKQPNLFIVGAPKCGTSSVARWMALHPDIFVPSVKEPHYYCAESIRCQYPNKDEYLSLYSPGVEHLYRLDASVRYLYSDVAVTNILKDCPEAKFVVCLRNPVDMAFSLHSEHLNKSGREDVSSFSEAWSLSDDRMLGRRLPILARGDRFLAYKDSCRIGSQANLLLERVPASQVHVVILDDFMRRPQETSGRLLQFLQLPEGPNPSFPHANPAQSLKYPGLKRALKHCFVMKSRLGVKRGMPKIGALARQLESRIDKFNSTTRKEQMDEATRRVVTAYFLDEIHKIWDLAGVRYPDWVECLDQA